MVQHRTVLVLVSVLLLVGVCVAHPLSGCGSAAAPKERKGEYLTLNEDFTSFNLELWKHEISAYGGGNWEFEYYLNNRTNSYVTQSCLVLQPTMTADKLGVDPSQNGATLDLWGTDPASLCTTNAFYGCTRTTQGATYINVIASARVRTAQTFSFKYGRVEVRAKLPRGDWIWPALWLLPEDQNFGGWPSSGEIDIMESRGNDASYPAGGVNAFGSTLHFGPDYQYNAFSAAHQSYTLPSGDFNQDFHVFGLYWNETNIYTYLDEDTPSNRVLNMDLTSKSFWQIGSDTQGWDKIGLSNPWVGQENVAPFDSLFYLIFDLAVGGTGGYFPEGVGNKPWSNTSPVAMQEFWNARGQWQATWNGLQSAMIIDYVRVWTFNQSEFRLNGMHVKNMEVVDPLRNYRQSMHKVGKDL